MQLVEYIGTMANRAKTIRRLPPQSFTRLGIELPDSAFTDGYVVWGPHNNHTVEMSNSASESLVAALPNEFRVKENADDALIDDEPEDEPEFSAFDQMVISDD